MAKKKKHKKRRVSIRLDEGVEVHPKENGIDLVFSEEPGLDLFLQSGDGRKTYSAGILSTKRNQFDYQEATEIPKEKEKP